MRKLLFCLLVAVCVTGLAALPAIASSGPSGEVLVGGNAAGTNGGSVIEPGYNDVTGAITYVKTPQGTAHPVPTNPKATAPFYLVVYPESSLNMGAPLFGVTLNCQDLPAENCPDHGAFIASVAEEFQSGVYGGGVAGHDHLFAPPGSGGDFNVAWRPIVVLFTDPSFVTHITTLAQLNSLPAGEVQELPLDGTFPGLPNLTFHCSVVPGSVYARGVPFTG
jgi:hypothetical protein